jgi:hypothetical protein
MAASSIVDIPHAIYGSLKNIFVTKRERNIIIDPFSCIIKLCLLNILPKGTKISIYDNKIYFNEPSYAQGVIRFMYGDNREDLHNLYAPINIFVNWYWSDSDMDMKSIFIKAVSGLKMLKASYSSWATIQHTIDYYILLLMRRNVDINSQLINNHTHTHSNTHTIPPPADGENSSTTYYGSIQLNSSNPHQDKKDKNKQVKNNQPNGSSVPVENMFVNMDNLIESQPSTVDAVLNTDVQKFLRELWKPREVIIIINLLKELDEKKNEPDETQNIYDNIMKYCNTKETKLFKFIEERSSILL